MRIILIQVLILTILMVLSCPNEPKIQVESELTIYWKTPTELIDIPNAELLVIDNEYLVYSGEEELLTAINVFDGSLLWKSERYDGRALRADHLLYSEQDNRIYGRHFNNIIVWESSTGQIVYELSDSLDGISASRVNFNTLMEDGYAILGENIDIHILGRDGNLKNNIDVPWTSRSVTNNGAILFLGQRNTINGGLTQGRIRSFSAITGDSIWTYQTDNGGFHAKLFYENGAVYGGTRGNSPNSEVVALNSETGQVIWRYVSENAKDWTNNFLVEQETIFIKGTSSSFAIDKITGAKKWSFNWANTSSVEIAYLNGFVYLTDTYHLYVLDEHSGELVHTEIIPQHEGSFWHLAVGNDIILAQTSASIIAYEPWHLRE